jgi:hypothetical protein
MIYLRSEGVLHVEGNITFNWCTEAMDRLHLSEDTVQWLVPVNTILEILRSRNVGSYLTRSWETEVVIEKGFWHSGMLGLWTLSIIWNSKYTWKPNVSETGSVSVLRWNERHLLCWVQWLRWALSKGPNRVSVSLSHLRTETDPVYETLCFLVFRIPDYGQSPETQ